MVQKLELYEKVNGKRSHFQSFHHQYQLLCFFLMQPLLFFSMNISTHAHFFLPLFLTQKEDYHPAPCILFWGIQQIFP